MDIRLRVGVLLCVVWGWACTDSFQRDEGENVSRGGKQDAAAAAVDAALPTAADAGTGADAAAPEEPEPNLEPDKDSGTRADAGVPDTGPAPECGNGELDADELCDDGNAALDDDCPDGPMGICEPARCGDGFLQADVEECDDGSITCSECKQCAPNFGDCNGDAADQCETDLLDTQHCGACDVVCEADEVCFGGACALVVATPDYRPAGMQIRNGKLYWLGRNDGLHALFSYDGSEIATVADGLPLFTGGLIVDDTHAYGTIEVSDTEEQIVRLPLAGGPLVTLAEGFGNVHRLLADETHLYWDDESSSEFMRVPKDGLASAEVIHIADLGYWHCVAIDTDRIYWVDDSTLRTSAKDATDLQLLGYGNNAEDSYSCELGDDYFYWDWNDYLFETAGIERIRKTGGEPERLPKPGFNIDNASYSVHRDDVFLAYTAPRDQPTNLTVVRIDSGSSDSVPIMSVETDVLTAVVADDDSIFVAVTDDGVTRLLRLRRR